jgi:hypothetical protein
VKLRGELRLRQAQPFGDHLNAQCHAIGIGKRHGVVFSRPSVA